MMLSLALAILLAAAPGADAAPQAKPGEPEVRKTAQMVTVSGKCTKLVHAGLAVDGCKPILMNLNYSTGVSAYWFMTEGTILSFSGDGSHQVEQDPDAVVQAIERSSGRRRSASSGKRTLRRRPPSGSAALATQPSRAQRLSAWPIRRRAATKGFS